MKTKINHEIERMVHQFEVPVRSRVVPRMIGKPKNTNKVIQSTMVESQLTTVFMNREPFHVSITKVVAMAIACDRLLIKTGMANSVPVNVKKLSPFCDVKPIVVSRRERCTLVVIDKIVSNLFKK